MRGRGDRYGVLGMFDDGMRGYAEDEGAYRSESEVHWEQYKKVAA